jgi:hypothetical protein
LVAVGRLRCGRLLPGLTTSAGGSSSVSHTAGSCFSRTEQSSTSPLSLLLLLLVVTCWSTGVMLLLLLLLVTAMMCRWKSERMWKKLAGLRTPHCTMFRIISWKFLQNNEM